MTTFKQVLVLPAHQELVEDLYKSIKSYCDRGLWELGPQSVLLILVLNEREEQSAWPYELLQRLGALPLEAPYFLGRLSQQTVLIWNGTKAPHLFTKKEGVGLARKIGSDIAATLIERGRVESPWIRAIDADTEAPEGFFAAEARFDLKAGLVTYPFWHEPSNEAINVYEMSLRYYTLALEWAESPWAYESVGSCQAVHVRAYRKVRAYPNRLAGEDFHLAAKIAKGEKIQRLSGVPPILLSSRRSHRVPFGTGVGVARNEAELARGESLKFYNPQIFVHLRQIQRALAQAVATQDYQSLFALRPESLATDEWISLLEACRLGREDVQRPLASSPQKEKQFQNLCFNFDALATLHFVHELERLYPPVFWKEALALAPWTSNLNETDLRLSLYHSESGLSPSIQAASFAKSSALKGVAELPEGGISVVPFAPPLSAS